MEPLSHFGLATPELILACSAMLFMMIGVYMKGDSTRLITVLSIVALLAAIVIEAGLFGDARQVAFNNLFVVDGFVVFTKILSLTAAVLALIMALPWLEKEQTARFEFPIMILFATLGMMMMISANNLLSLYLGLELQSLSLYVLAAYHRDSMRSTEAGVKYFVLGAVASGLLLFGMSYVYGFSGQTDFGFLQVLLTTPGEETRGVIIGLVFMLAGLAFKVSAVPFHMWTPDVYEGAPTPVTSFFAVAPKIAAFALLIRVVMVPFIGISDHWQQIIVILAVASMFVGAFAAIAQRNIKRMMAYSSIGHVGYGLIGLAVANEEGVRAVLVYLAIYLFMNLGTFGIILSMRVKDRAVEGIDDLAGLSKNHPVLALIMMIMMFSMAGIPPLAGFFGKVYVFLAAVHGGMYVLAVFGVLTSVVGAFYYVRIIKIMYFDEPAEPFDAVTKPVGLVLGLSTVVILLFFVFPGPVVTAATAAARILIQG